MKKTFKPRNKKSHCNLTAPNQQSLSFWSNKYKSYDTGAEKVKEYELIFPRIYTGRQLGFRLVIEKSFYF